MNIKLMAAPDMLNIIPARFPNINPDKMILKQLMISASLLLNIYIARTIAILGSPSLIPGIP
jgi:hypothetical protein